ncbi:F-box/kelch-repeat protein At3g06240-like [Rutidosis leptorrhynchoides]|uniref:F-box/kelch-repeat protein At3g06240-like n=1 Tax=Rutidosis leptorrhynchoides TaxID=125765 RepID=UPI003A98E950
MASELSTTLPPVIITNILCRLPAKSVGRFRCVSKDWLSQLSSYKFIKNHESTLNQKHVIFNSLFELSLYTIPFNPHEKIPKKLRYRLWFQHFHGCCNGLVSWSAAFLNENYMLRHIIINPTTKEIARLPVSGDEIIDGISNGKIVYGFGYDSLTDDYKVVTISNIHRDNLVNVDVTMRVHVFDAGVFSNGFLHWLEINDNKHLGNIVAFSLLDEKFNEMTIPKIDFVYDKNCKLIDLGGKFGLFLEQKREVWLMNEYGVNESWTKILLHGFNETRMIFRPMIFGYNGKFMVVGKNRRFIYDVEGSFSENVEISHNFHLIVVGSYVESLVSPQSLQGVTEGTLNLNSGGSTLASVESGDPTSLEDFLQTFLQVVGRLV